MDVRRICAGAFGVAMIAAEGGPADLPATFRPVVQCMYNILKAKEGVDAIDVYAYGDITVIFEISFRNKSGVRRTGLGVHNSPYMGRYPYHGVDVTNDGTWGEGADFLEPVWAQLESSCSLEESLWTVAGSVPPWRRIDMDH